MILVLIAAAMVGIPWLITELVDWFSPNWDSIYDPRSKFRRWADERRGK